MFKKASFIVTLLTLGCVTAQRPQASNEVLMGEWETKLARMESLFQDQIHQLAAQNNQLKAEVEELKLKRTARQAESQNLKQQLERLTAAPAPNGIESRAAPRNCLELTQIGHRLRGLYMVQSATNQIQTIYCDINQATGAVVSETVVGYNEVKSSPVYFYVQRNTVFSNAGSVIPYNIAKLNIGNAFNLVTGIFTVPKNGRYFFSLSGISQPRTGSTRVFLYVSGLDSGSSFAVDQYDTFSFQAILDLKAGNLVTTYLSEGSVGDASNANLHFTGHLLDEDLPAVN